MSDAPLEDGDPTAASAGSWLEQCEDPDTYGSIRCTFRIRTGGSAKLVRVRGWSDVPAAALLLGELGFTAAAHRPLEVVVESVDRKDLRVVRRFEIEPGREGDVLSELALALAGRTGGLLDVLTRAMTFHRAESAFERAWKAAGCPPVELGALEMVAPVPASGDGPAEPAWRAHRTVAADLRRRGGGG